MDALNIEYKNGYALVQIDNGKVNAINTILAKNLRDAFLDFENDKKVGGVVSVSYTHLTLPTIYSV